MRGTIQDRWWSSTEDGKRAKSGRYRQGLRYKAIYRAPDGRQHSKSFDTKERASQWLRVELSKIDGGAWIDPRAGQLRYEAWASEWLTGLDIKPKTLEGYRSLLRSRILPTFGEVKLSQISPSMVRRWVAEMSGEGLSASRVKQARAVLRQSLEVARTDGLIGTNPTQGVKAPQSRRREPVYLTAEQVAELAATAEGIQEGSEALVWFLSLTGLRWGEAVALRRSSLDLMRRRVTVSESATEVHGKLVFGSPKSHKSRVVVFPRFLADRLTNQCAGLGPNDQVFTAPKGGYLRSANYRKAVWKPALCVAGFDESLRIHDLRATAASLMIAAGASIKAVQRALGHASAKVTLDTYAGLFDDDLEALADRLDERLSVTNVAPVLPQQEADVKELRTNAL
ncbi:MAG: site-specific integrase [Acidimicrobiia bacterium]